MKGGQSLKKGGQTSASLRRLVFTAWWLLFCYRDICDSEAPTKTHSEVVWTPGDHQKETLQQNKENGPKISQKDDLFLPCFPPESPTRISLGFGGNVSFLSITGRSYRRPLDLFLDECV